MKTRIKKLSLGALILITGVVFSSFIGNNKESNGENNWGAVYNYVSENICKPIRIASPKSKKSTDQFSRCPSGYTPEFVTEDDDVKKENFVYGTVAFYRGCNPTYVCDFKVCVDKGIALVKSKGSEKYTTVDNWLAQKKKKQEQKDIVMKAL